MPKIFLELTQYKFTIVFHSKGDEFFDERMNFLFEWKKSNVIFLLVSFGRERIFCRLSFSIREAHFQIFRDYFCFCLVLRKLLIGHELTTRSADSCKHHFQHHLLSWLLSNNEGDCFDIFPFY